MPYCLKPKFAVWGEALAMGQSWATVGMPAGLVVKAEVLGMLEFDDSLPAEKRMSHRQAQIRCNTVHRAFANKGHAGPE